jgi:hypothetical protein
MVYIDEATSALFRTSGNRGLFFKLESDPALHLWSGFSDVDAGIPSTDLPSGDRYIGAGVFKALPELEAVINGTATSLEFTIDGVLPEYAERVDEEAPDVLGSVLRIGIAALDERWQPVTPIIWLTRGIADYWSMDQRPVKGDRNATRTLSLVVTFGASGRSRPRRASWTPAQQQAFPVPSGVAPDRFCDQVFRYQRGHQVSWPRS